MAQIKSKIRCPNCNAVKKGVLLETYDDSKGHIRVKCKKCDAYITVDLETEEIILVEPKE